MFKTVNGLKITHNLNDNLDMAARQDALSKELRATGEATNSRIETLLRQLKKVEQDSDLSSKKMDNLLQQDSVLRAQIAELSHSAKEKKSNPHQIIDIFTITLLCALFITQIIRFFT